LVREAGTRKEVARNNFQVVPRSAVMEAPQSTELPEQKVPVSKEIPDR